MNKNKIRVLAVDDDSRLRKLLQSYLEEEGFYSLSAKDGDEMKEILSSQSVDLVILDVMLPGDDGLSLARNLRTQYSIPIIMLSAKGKDIDRMRVYGLFLDALKTIKIKTTILPQIHIIIVSDHFYLTR